MIVVSTVGCVSSGTFSCISINEDCKSLYLRDIKSFLETSPIKDKRNSLTFKTMKSNRTC